MPVVLEEIATEAEQPDVIAWDYRGRSIVVECKASRADYLADRAKHFRRDPTLGMGRERFFAAPAGLLEAAELPDGWGLVEVSERGCRTIRSAAVFGASNDRAEKALLVSALGRAREGWGRGVFGEAAPADAMVDGDPHPKVARLMRKQAAEIDRLKLEVQTVSVRAFACRQCGKPTEEGRRCYVAPVCYACLPPPPPLPVRAFAAAATATEGEVAELLRLEREGE